jgi:hypothetical protein
MTTASRPHRGPGFWKTVIWTSLLLAGALSMFDPLAPFTYTVIPVCSSTAECVGPDDQTNVATMPRAASATNASEWR